MAQSVRILVVDDDPEMRALLVEELRREGWKVREAGDGAEAVLACRGSRFDVMRNSTKIGTGKVISLQSQRQDITEALEGNEFGIWQTAPNASIPGE